MPIRFDGKPIFSGDPNTNAVIFNNLAGVNFEDKARWQAYVDMMNVEFLAETPLMGSPRFQCNNWRYANPALARGWCW